MGTLIRRHGAPELRRTRNSFQSLGRAILYQQLHGKAAATIYGRFRGLYGGRFPKPAQLDGESLERLRTAGVSRQKGSYLIDLARHYDEGLVTSRRFSRMSNDEISAQLTQVRGIGQWSVDMFLIFGLNRPDVLPLGDYGVRMGLQKFLGVRGKPKAARLERGVEHWRPYRSVGSWYMWRVHESA
jgi:DNA-3-methyladenine glycosylase II